MSKDTGQRAFTSWLLLLIAVQKAADSSRIDIMPHADSSLVPETIQTKAEFWEHVYEQIQGLLDGQRHWISNLANASSVIFNSLQAFPKHFGNEDRAVNWAGFYIHADFFPSPRLTQNAAPLPKDVLLLGPFCGKPACQYIPVAPGKVRGVCGDTYLNGTTTIVPDVDAYPGHIACDGETKSEIVCPLVLGTKVIGVLDLDCLALNGFDNEDKKGLEKIAQLVVESSDW